MSQAIPGPPPQCDTLGLALGALALLPGGSVASGSSFSSPGLGRLVCNVGLAMRASPD